MDGKHHLKRGLPLRYVSKGGVPLRDESDLKFKPRRACWFSNMQICADFIDLTKTITEDLFNQMTANTDIKTYLIPIQASDAYH